MPGLELDGPGQAVGRGLGRAVGGQRDVLDLVVGLVQRRVDEARDPRRRQVVGRTGQGGRLAVDDEREVTAAAGAWLAGAALVPAEAGALAAGVPLAVEPPHAVAAMARTPSIASPRYLLEIIR